MLHLKYENVFFSFWNCIRFTCFQKKKLMILPMHNSLKNSLFVWLKHDKQEFKFI